jgi:cytochrome c oxidase cbb3-type subunit 3
MKPSPMKIYFALWAMFFFQLSISAQDTLPPASNSLFGGQPGFDTTDLLIWALGFLAILLLIYAIAQVSLIRLRTRVLENLIRQEKGRPLLPEPLTLMEWYEKRVVGLKPMEQEADLIMEDHSYDGIQELDNGMPPWLQAFFVGTIGFALVYMLWYQILDYGPNPTQEYEAQMEEGKVIKEAYALKMANSMNAETVTLATEPSELAEGKGIFIGNCAACHGNAGEGGAGPNLTDAYWIHGGGIKELFTTITHGIPEKGMIAWNDQLSPAEIRNVASYILSLQGSNPANAMPPQGELWNPSSIAADSLSSQSDTVQMAKN